MKYFCLLAMILLYPYLMYTQANVIDEVICTVGDDIIFRSDVENAHMQMKMTNRCVESNLRNILKQLVIQKLYLHQAKLDSITIPKLELSQMTEFWINHIINQLGSEKKVEEYFGKSINVLREERQQIIKEQSMIKLIQNMLINNIKITPYEVCDFYNLIPKDSLPFIPTIIKLKILTLDPIISSDEIYDIKKKLIEYTRLILSGERKFSTLACLYSEDIESARKGGELGFIPKSSLPLEFAIAAFRLNDSKKVSKIVKTEYGYHIIQLIGKKGNYVNVRHILLKPHVSKKELARIFNQLNYIRSNILSGKTTFEKAVTCISQDVGTRNNKGLMVNYNSKMEEYIGTPYFLLEDLPLEIGRIVSEMKVGDISDPFVMMSNQKKNVAIIKLESKSEAHRANLLNDYQVIKKNLRYQKRNLILNLWLEKKMRDVCIHSNYIWENCDFQIKN
ncbi:MAG: peptidylprolyl isomerase [Bacteroidales bacterium OttesenSCG-928-I14]|jgi:peptidyl-prolyl cis-trans isomerase SurA|nr:peptidylprolyl isomerase [Bacteroidales bacterium OttesenSCG-928-I14]